MSDTKPTPDHNKRTPITPEDRELGRKLVRPFLDMQGPDAIDAAERACQIIADHRATQSATQLQTIGEREARIRELEGALRATTDECKQTLKDIGGCDHSVAVCCCDLIRIIEDAEALLAVARPAHTEGQPQPNHYLK